jgi:carbonic anhydrase
MRLISILLLALASAGAWAGRWVPLTEGANRAVYLDTAGLVRDGGMVRTWVREVYTQEQRAEQVGVYYYSANSLMSYDCARRTWAPLMKVFYGGDGTELRRLSLDAVEAPVLAAPGSMQEGLLERACEHAQKTAKKTEPMAATQVALAQTGVRPSAASASPESGNLTSAAPREVATASTGEAKPDAKPAEANGGKPRPAPPAATEGANARGEGSGKGGGDANGDTKVASGSARSNADLLLARRAPRTQVAHAPRTRAANNGHAKPRARRERPAVAELEPEPEPERHWGYHGAGGPEHWGKLNADFAACAQGKRQSPIDIKDGARLELEPIRFDYKPAPLRIVDSGHTVQINYAEGSHITVAGERYELKQFHFHKPSEERIDGRWFDMVAHLVHRSGDGRLAVVAVLFEARQQPNAFLRTLWPHLPLESGREFAPAEVTIDATALLPEVRTYFTYIGSLTTPPCTEGVLWIVLKTPLEVSPEQVAVFGKLYSANARPVQPANGRLIKESM